MNPGGDENRYQEFGAALRQSGLFPLRAEGIQTLQINFGKICNQACRHCHVEAGPKRTESIAKDTLVECLRILREAGIPSADLTGGAPELNPHFRWFVQECHGIGIDVIVRCNLTVLLEAGQEDLSEFFRDQEVEIVASLPHYSERSVDQQRGGGVFEKSVEAMRLLNRLGYGRPGTGLVLNLVFNPGGAFLPPAQGEIEADFRRELGRRFSVTFNHVLTLTNMPIGRFREFLESTRNYRPYMERLIESFNPKAAAAVMCRNMLSVGWDGGLYDCDFNQMLGLTCDHGVPAHVRDFDAGVLAHRQIVTNLHCYGCTAGSGSSCGGSLIDED